MLSIINNSHSICTVLTGASFTYLQILHFGGVEVLQKRMSPSVCLAPQRDKQDHMKRWGNHCRIEKKKKTTPNQPSNKQNQKISQKQFH